MSFDVYLLPLQPDDDFDAAMALFSALDRNDPDYAYDFDARDAPQTILELDPRYQRFKMDPAEAKKIAETDAGKSWLQAASDSVQLCGEDMNGQPLAQFHFSRYHITIHCYSGTTADELDHYVIALCGATGLATVDPQECVVWRIQEDGTLA